MIRSHIPNEPLALWASRFSVFALALLLVVFLLHRLGILGTPVAMTATGVAFACAALGILIGLVAWISVWTRGRKGAGRVAIGILGGGLLWLWPLASLPNYMSLPPINDVTTDTANPPRFAAIAKERPPGARNIAYTGDRYARLQQNAYPDLRTLVVDRSAEEVFEYARLTAAGRKGLGWKIIALEPPTLRPAKPGIIEATSRTTIIGFIDDVVIRVSGNDSEARLDIRSSSRFGRHDFGANASRVRRFIRELQTRLDASPPGSLIAARAAAASRAAAAAKTPLPAGVKRPVERTSDTKGGKGKGDAKDAPKKAGQKG
jgi:hypothetical protein